jgi:hypothetical protein
MSKSCYTHYEHLLHTSQEAGVFDDAIDGVFILTMTSTPDRLRNTLEHLRDTKLYNRPVVIQVNEGYVTCDKGVVNNTFMDICHAVNTCFEYALHRGWSRVLVLEDDVIINVKRLHKYGQGICKYIATRDPDVYHLGPLGVIGLPVIVDQCHIQFVGGGMYKTAHAVMYNKRYMKRYIDMHLRGSVTEADRFADVTSDLHCCIVPIAKQIFSPTENQRTMWKAIDLFCMRAMRLHESTDNYDITFHLFMWFWWCLVALGALVVMCIAYMVIARKALP